ncbi:Spy/CpxP family protein refolding chaperone [Roseateles sp. DAIF2]|uniref:Spy/CpxP family protein refolding chaperone n=1 Tax=Roseateles sp. DAIF2 TaxID=2714952 RepID=UPI0018A2CD80|nr:Spy/CpxP family protein refolding chaperone [Roseateles sp. DAIF2]QPF74394.1 Spy/CpxP family protein refolding chaperone [Roseateles sp. DAIF2]
MSTMKLMHQVAKAAALAAALGFGAAQALPGGMHRAGGPGHHAEQMLDLVDASDAQRSQIRQIMKSAAEELKPQRQSLHELHKQGRSLLAAPSVDAAAVESVRQQSQALHEQVSKRMSQALVAAANVLTPEQRAKLAERMAKREARMAERMKEHRQPRGHQQH